MDQREVDVEENGFRGHAFSRLGMRAVKTRGLSSCAGTSADLRDSCRAAPSPAAIDITYAVVFSRLSRRSRHARPAVGCLPACSAPRPTAAARRRPRFGLFLHFVIAFIWARDVSYRSPAGAIRSRSSTTRSPRAVVYGAFIYAATELYRAAAVGVSGRFTFVPLVVTSGLLVHMSASGCRLRWRRAGRPPVRSVRLQPDLQWSA